MTEAEWLSSADAGWMLAWITCAGPSGDGERDLERWQQRPSDRKLRLFAVACCRQVWPLLTDERSRRAVEALEQEADGRDPALDGAIVGGKEPSYEYARGLDRRGMPALADRATWNAADAVALLCDALSPSGLDRLGDFLRCLSRAEAFAAGGRPPSPASAERWELPWAASLLREVVGNPWRPMLSPYVRRAGIDRPLVPETRRVQGFQVAWLTPAVLAIAQRCYDERDWQGLPILADALEDVGCDNAAILTHLHSPGPHVRGCWALDLILGKE